MKTNLIIDSSFFFRRSLSATDFSKYLSKDEKVLDSAKTQAIFIRKVAMDLAFQIKKFSDLGISRVIMCNDSSSWRKTLYSEYKGTRTKDDVVNWTKFYNLCDYLIGILSNKGCVVTSINGLEGDDLIYYYTLLFKQEDNLNVVVSSDKDLKQLVNHNTIVHNVITGKSTVANNFKVNADNTKNVNILQMNDESFHLNKMFGVLKGLLQESERIDSYSILFNKVLLGDKGDNIPNLIPMFGGKKVEGIIAKYEEKLYNKEFFLNLLNDEDSRMELFDMMKEQKKTIEFTDELQKKIIQNIKLTWLSTEVIPKEHSMDFKKWVSENKSVLNTRASVTKMTSMVDILEGTEYVSNNDYENDDSIFRAVDFKALD